MTYSLTVTHVDEQAIVRVLQIGRQGVSGPVEDFQNAPLADPETLQFLFGWDGSQIVRVDLDALAGFLSPVTDNDYAAWAAAF